MFPSSQHPLTSWLAIWPLPTTIRQGSGRIPLGPSPAQPSLRQPLQDPSSDLLPFHFSSWLSGVTSPSLCLLQVSGSNPFPAVIHLSSWFSGHTPPPSTGHVLPGEPMCLRYQILLPTAGGPCFPQPQLQNQACTPQSWDLPLQIPGLGLPSPNA